MAQFSKHRQQTLTADAETVRRLYIAACARWGQQTVDADLRRLWDLRCMWGIQSSLPFGCMESRTLGELLYVARAVCGYGIPF